MTTTIDNQAAVAVPTQPLESGKELKILPVPELPENNARPTTDQAPSSPAPEPSKK